MMRLPVTRTGWRATGATHCTHDSGAEVWLRWRTDRWRYRVPGEDETATNSDAFEHRSFATRDEAMAAAELALPSARGRYMEHVRR